MAAAQDGETHNLLEINTKWSNVMLKSHKSTNFQLPQAEPSLSLSFPG